MSISTTIRTIKTHPSNLSRKYHRFAARITKHDYQTALKPPPSFTIFQHNSPATTNNTLLIIRCIYLVTSLFQPLPLSLELKPKIKTSSFVIFDQMLANRREPLTGCRLVAYGWDSKENPNDRPSMLEVYSMLENENKADIMTPKKHETFSKKAYEDEQNKATIGLEICSSNDAKISQLVGR
ncbi:hypothetical protein WN943_026133 [Citrus x changshan-huyou]